MLRAIVLTAVLFSSATAFAHPAHQPDRDRGRVDVRTERADARRDIVALERIRSEYDLALARRDLRALRSLDARFIAELRLEIQESQRLVRTEHGNRQERSEMKQTRRILREVERLAGRSDRSSLRARRSLLDEAMTLARQEVRQERREDRTEHAGWYDRRG